MIGNYLKNLLASYSYLVLTRNGYFGFLLVAISFLNPSSGLLALIAYTSSILLGRLIGLSRDQMVSGMFTYNSVLVGLSMGYLFEISFLSIFFTVIASFFALLLSFALHTIFSLYLRLPILNIPFTITATLVYLSSIRYGNLYVTNTMRLSFLNFESFPIWLSGLLKSVGILMFLPYDLVGILVLSAMLLFSRINFLLILVGYYSGTLFLSVLKGSSYAAFTELYSFNFILIALALGGLFLIPSVKSYIIAISGVLISVFVLDAVNILWASYGIPAFTVPFVVVVPLMIYVLSISRFPLVTTTFLHSPEANLEHYVNYTARFNNNLPQPHLPFSGEWQVYQGFNGEWTHKGIWAYGIDFVIADRQSGRTFRNSGQELGDYYALQKPVLSPVSGKVIAMYNDYDDNPPGVSDKQNNWGNYVVVLGDWGYYVEVSHFAKNSIVVKSGEIVMQGQLLGRCGSSGNSPEPHIHMQCQLVPHIGAPTVPFAFTNCITDGRCSFGSAGTPAQGNRIRPVVRSRLTERKLQYTLGERIRFGVYRNTARMRDLVVNIRMADDGSYFFADDEGKASLYYTIRDGVFAFFRFEGNNFSPLRYLMIALPRMPLTEEAVSWCDEINYGLVRPQSRVVAFIKSLNHSLFKATGTYSIDAGGSVSGIIEHHAFSQRKRMLSRVEFLPEKGFSRIELSASNSRHELRVTEDRT